MKVLGGITISNRLFSIITSFDMVVDDSGVENRYFFSSFSRDIGNFFDVRDDKISYMPRNIIQKLNRDNKWKKEGRQLLSGAKFLLSFNISDEDMNVVKDKDILNKIAFSFDNHLKEQNIKKFFISKSIKSVYAIPNSKDCGTLKRSCMRIESESRCRNFAELFDFLPSLRVVYIKDNSGKLKGRALLWLLTEHDDNNVFYLDRCYGSDSAVAFLYSIAEKRNWLTRSTEVDAFIPYLRYKSDFDIRDYVEEYGSPFFDSVCHLQGRYNLSSRSGYDTVRLQSASGEIF